MRGSHGAWHLLLTSLIGGAMGLLSASTAFGDTLVLIDGTRLNGTIRKAEGGYNVVAENGESTFVPDSRVAAFELGGRKSSSTQPADDSVDYRLASLRRSVENLDDLSIIITRYERFLEQNKNTPVADLAAEDLKIWMDHRDRGLIKHGGEWITPAERDQQLRENFLKAAEARLQIKNGENAAARSTLEEMLAANPDDVSALYLQAVLDYRAGELGKAKSALERVREQVPEHAPTLVNLAAINLEQNRDARGLRFLEEAMRAQPNNREILDNVAEALAMVPKGTAEGRVAEQARQLFLAQDAVLRQEMAGRGFYRWGSGWVSREEHEQLRALEEEINATIGELDERYRELELQVSMIDRKVVENERYLDRLQAARTYIDPNGRIVQTPLPPVYFEVEREQQQLGIERERYVNEMQRVRAEAQQQNRRYPVPPFKGALQIIGEDGVPVTMPPEVQEGALPATQPATGPSTGPTTRPGEAGGTAPL